MTYVLCSSNCTWLGRKKKLFGCPPPPAPTFKIWKKVFTLQKYTAPNFKNSKKVCLFFENFDLSKIFLSCCFQLVYILIPVLNLYKDMFGKVDLFAPLLGDIEAIIPCSFDFDLKKKNPPARPFSKKKKKKKSCGGQPNNYFFRP